MYGYKDGQFFEEQYDSPDGFEHAVKLLENHTSMSSSLSDRSRDDIRCYGQTKEHAIAIALEQLADDYRSYIDENQSKDWLVVERSDSGEPMTKHYHVILHYERIAEAESKFQAMHDTLMGNTVVENAKITVVEISPDTQIAPVMRSWD